MYCLVLFYHEYLAELSPMRPLPKFICIKMVVFFHLLLNLLLLLLLRLLLHLLLRLHQVVFFSFWQSVLIALLVKAGVIAADVSWTSYDVKDVAAGLQDFLICIEMFFAAVGHVWAFPHDDFKLDQKPDLNCKQKMLARAQKPHPPHPSHARACTHTHTHTYYARTHT